MRRLILILFFFSISFSFFSQKSLIIHRSDYKHDYALSTLRMVEELADTARCKYIATMKVTGTHNDGLVGEVLTLMKIKAKELGANLYCVNGYAEYGKDVEVTLRLFFGGNKLVSLNDSKRKQNFIYIFNQSRAKSDSAFVFINGERINFDQRKFHTVNQEAGVKYKIQTSQKALTKLTLSRKKSKEASFIVVPSSKRQVSPVYIPAGAASGAMMAGAAGVALYFTFKNNLPEKINYDLGRFLYEIYK